MHRPAGPYVLRGILPALGRFLLFYGGKNWLDRLSEFLQVEILQFFSQRVVFGALLFAWDVLFSARAGRALWRSHPRTLARSDSDGYLETA